MIALDAALGSLGLVPGDAVALSALSQAWVHKVLIAKGLLPVWLDVDQASASLNQASFERLASTPVKALYLAEPWGIMPDPEHLSELGIPIIEDATYSIGSISGEHKAGFLGTFTIIGLEHASSITAGGGALLYAPGRRDSQALRNSTDSLVAEERMSDVNAALALSQIKDLEKFIVKRRELSDLYAQSLARAHRRPLAPACEGESASFGCVVVLESAVKDVRAYAKKKDVNTVMAFDDTCAAAGMVPEGSCPLAASLVNRSVAFPLNQRIGKTAAQKIAKVLATLP
jgi:dTDP-4-amino-4,6-dideoxygalactose transaminase